MKRLWQISLLALVCQIGSVLANAERVVAVGGDITEIVYALGQQHRLVAVDTTSTYPAETSSLAKVGYLRALPAEGIASLKPDLVLASNSAGPAVIWPQLKGAGIDLARISSEPSLAAVAPKITQVAEALDVLQQGESLLRQFRSDLLGAGIDGNEGSLPITEKAPKVLFILGHGGGTPMVAGEQTSADTMIRLAGGRNVFSGFSGYKPMTAEAVVRANPDIVLLTTQGSRGLGNSDGVLKLPGIGFTEAGRQRRILDYDALLLLGFGLRTPQLVQQMRTDLHKVMTP